MFIPRKNKDSCVIEYFDSSGDPTPKEDVNKFISKYFSNHKLLTNSIKHQKDNINCGVYVIEYIIQRLQGKTFKQLIANPIKIDRSKYFR